MAFFEPKPIGDGDSQSGQDNSSNSPREARPPACGRRGSPGAAGLVNGAISRHKQRYGNLFGTVTVNQNGLKAKRDDIQPPYGVSHSTKRTEIRGFSESARRRMQDYLTTIDWQILKREFKNAKFARGVFGTLTYPEGFSEDWHNWKRHLDNFRKHLVRAYGQETSVIWKLENQELRCIKTGVEFIPHFHLAIDFKKRIYMPTFRVWLSATWYSVVGSGNEKHLKAGTNALVIYGETGKLVSYLCKYLSKTYKTEVHTGRVWGVWNKFELAPSKTYTGVEWVKLLRRIRKYGKYSNYLKHLHAQKTLGFRMFGENLEQLVNRGGEHDQKR